MSCLQQEADRGCTRFAGPWISKLPKRKSRCGTSASTRCSQHHILIRSLALSLPQFNLLPSAIVMESTARAHLPTKLIEGILRTTWESTISPRERQMLLSTFALADPSLHGHLARTATGIDGVVILDVS